MIRGALAFLVANESQLRFHGMMTMSVDSAKLGVNPKTMTLNQVSVGCDFVIG